MALTDYTPTVWKNGEAGGTPLDADHLNKIEQGISALHTAITARFEKTDGPWTFIVEGTTATLAVKNAPLSLQSGNKYVAFCPFIIPVEYRFGHHLSVGASSGWNQQTEGHLSVNELGNALISAQFSLTTPTNGEFKIDGALTWAVPLQIS